MAVCDDDMGDLLPGFDGGQNRVELGCLCRSGINHGQPARAQKIRIRAAIGHRRRIGGDDPAQAGFKQFWHADGRIEVVGWCHGLTFRARVGLANV